MKKSNVDANKISEMESVSKAKTKQSQRVCPNTHTLKPVSSINNENLINELQQNVVVEKQSDNIVKVPKC